MSTMQVFWCFPYVCRTEVNIDGVARGVSSFAGCGRIFRDSCSNYVGSFSSFLVFNMLFMLTYLCCICSIEDI